MRSNQLESAIQQYTEKNGFGLFEPKTVLFDMDGVLYDSMPNHAIAWQRSMAEFGIRMTADDAYATEGARGIDTIRMMVRQQQGKDISEEEAQHMYDRKAAIFHDMPEAKVFDGVLPLMQAITDSGMTVGVVTGSGQRPLINRLLTDFGEYLSEEHIVTAYDVEHGKPAPDPYLTGLRKAGNLMPWEGIVVENAPLGIKAGASARIFTIAINSGPLPDDTLRNAGADILFDNITKLYDTWNSLSKNL